MSESVPTAAQGAPMNFRLLGVIAFIIGAAAVLMTRLLSLIAPLMISTGMPSAYSLISGMGVFANALSLILGIAALVLGLIVLLRRGAPKGFAAAGAALGGAEILNALIGFGQAAFYSFL
ncbi:hypothetical protein [Agromyces cerinus]|uniref:Uncharacterized protein n=1 Tax=Agromyces cerinus subsp. cerinus TaxID=232089 RepID=A0A1N6I407_9MICO|nr:hypothetical protein [Agromyces cerinus]SIO26731.1 hypothetical protein SAMN05443544_3650 [Agromyces cerinus subsp. cerinus]